MMLYTVASPLSCDTRDHAVSHHGSGELRSHGKSAFNVEERKVGRDFRAGGP